MVGDDEAGRVQQQLEEALGLVEEHARISARLARAQSAETSAREAAFRARATLADEEQDVRRLESFSTARIWATLKGRRDTDLDRHQAEHQAAQYDVARAEALLLDCRDQTRRIESELDALGDVTAARERALDAKETWLRGVPGQVGERLTKLAEELAETRAELTEIREAIAAGASAAGALDRTRDKLGSAEDWATFDTFFGGGMVSDAMKYSRMDEAQQLLHATDRALRHLSTELADTQVTAVVDGLAVDGLTRTFDIWFDNIFSDWSVRDRIVKAKGRADQAAGLVFDIRERLARRDHELAERVTALAGERERLLTGPSAS